jgi:hypothetical protein
MQTKKQFYYSHRTHSGQFYAKAEYLKNQTRARIALVFFLSATLAFAAYEATTSLLIK